jgi:hypothetical protein
MRITTVIRIAGFYLNRLHVSFAALCIGRHLSEFCIIFIIFVSPDGTGSPHDENQDPGGESIENQRNCMKRLLFFLRMLSHFYRIFEFLVLGWNQGMIARFFYGGVD